MAARDLNITSDGQRLPDGDQVLREVGEDSLRRAGEGANNADGFEDESVAVCGGVTAEARVDFASSLGEGDRMTQEEMDRLFDVTAATDWAPCAMPEEESREVLGALEWLDSDEARLTA